jgi:hypothetical protein
VVSNDLIILLVCALVYGLAWLGLLACISLTLHFLRGAKAVDVERFLDRSVRIGVVASAGLAVVMTLIWVVYKWKPDFGFWGRFVHPYVQLSEAGILLGVCCMTAFLALLRRGKKAKKR